MNQDDKQYLFWTMRCLATHFGVEVDQQKLRRLTTEFEPKVEEGPEELTRDLMGLADQMGFRISQFNANAKQIDSLLDEDLPLVAAFEDEAGESIPVVLHRRRGRKYLMMDPTRRKSFWITREAFYSKVERLTDEKNSLIPVRVAQRIVVSEGSSSSQSTSPMRWLWNLVAPETSDIRMVVLFSIIVALLALATPITVEALVNTVAFGRYFQPVLILSLILFVFLAFRAALIGVNTWIAEIIQRRLFVRVIADLAYRIPKLHQSVFDKNYVPELLNRFFDIVTVQKVVVSFLLDGLMLIMQAIVGMAVLAFYHPYLLGYDLVLLAFLTVFLYFLGRGAVKTSIKESKTKYYVAAWLQEIGRSPTAFGRNSGGQLAHHRSDELAQHYIHARADHFSILMRQIFSALGLQAIAATGLLALGGWLVIQRELTLGQLVAAELIVTIIVGSVAKLGKHMEAFYDALASADKLRQILTLPIEQNGYHIPADLSNLGDIRAEKLSYSFENAALKFPDFHLQSGQSMAVVGPAGSGKSTLMQLLSGVRSPKTGTVRLAGVPSTELNMTLAEQEIGVAAGIEVVAGSVAQNVHLNRSNVRSMDVRDALQKVCLLDEIERLPEGVETHLASLGQPLTSSQCLRLMLARAIVVRPKLLLIDGTLDGLSDPMIEQVLHQITGSETPWSTVIATGRNSIRHRCQSVLDLGSVEFSYNT